MSGLPPELQARIDAVKRAADLVATVRRRVPKLRQAGREFSALCPFHDEATASFTVSPDKRFYHCFGCGAHGDALAFVQAFDGVEFGEALKRLEAECGIGPSTARTSSSTAQGERSKRESCRRTDTSWIDSTAAGQAVWRAGVSARGTLVETYLRARGIDPLASGALDVALFHPRCPVRLWRRWEGPGDVRETCPAMLLPICRIEGARGERRWVQQGVELVFLEPDGRAKKRFAAWRGRDGRERVPPNRKIWGELQGGAVPIPALPVAPSGAGREPSGSLGFPRTSSDRRSALRPEPGPDWNDGRWLDGPGELVVGEGLESTLSLLARMPGHRGACAALSLDNLQGRWVEERVGRDWVLPLWNLRPDPGRACFTVPDAGAVTIGVDADMKGLKDRKVQARPKGPVERRDLSGAERSAICGQLAAAQWRAAGAGPVRVVRPPMGQDFNDLDRRAA